MEIISRRLEYWHRCGGSLWVGDFIKNQEFTLRLKRADCDFSRLLLLKHEQLRRQNENQPPSAHRTPLALDTKVNSPESPRPGGGCSHRWHIHSSDVVPVALFFQFVVNVEMIHNWSLAKCWTSHVFCSDHPLFHSESKRNRQCRCDWWS